MMAPDLLVWQVVDSAFPTGAFAHSSGLEAAWRQGEIRGDAALRAFLDATIRQAGYASLPLVNAAYRAPERLEAIDETANAFLTNAVGNRASRTQGRAFVSTAARVWPSPALVALQIRARGIRAHLAPVFGVTFHALGLPLSTVQQLALFTTARGVLSAGVRLGIVGSYEAQRLQHDTAPVIARTAERCGELGLDDLVQTEPIIDLLQAQHDRLYSRLFQS